MVLHQAGELVRAARDRLTHQVHEQRAHLVACHVARTGFQIGARQQVCDHGLVVVDSVGFECVAHVSVVRGQGIDEVTHLPVVQRVDDHVHSALRHVDELVAVLVVHRRVDHVLVDLVAQQIVVERLELGVDARNLCVSHLQLLGLELAHVEATIASRHVHRCGAVRVEDPAGVVPHASRLAVHLTQRDLFLRDVAAQVRHHAFLRLQCRCFELVHDHEQRTVDEAVELLLELVHPRDGNLIRPEERAQDLAEQRTFAGAVRAVQDPGSQRDVAILQNVG